MTISNNKMVTLSYTLRANDKTGDVIEQTTADKPLQFIYGIGQMIPGFETNLEGKKQGDTYDMMLKPEDAYGEVNEDAIVELDKSIFMADGVFEEERFIPGAHIPMQTADGQRLNGIIESVGDEKIKMNFNHPLAGMNLHFEGDVIEVRDATPEELAPAAGCGCDDGNCDDGDCSSNDSGCNC
ncbi:MAG: peptidylprolyl isomerase [Prolixibacteraceae bacterium]|jgi:FKBP-type peptidyl-prolyl cis-trans isomerase SlyD|nr:peptidylprolyl isomerase [Prolixibacteraceae bacterium]